MTAESLWANFVDDGRGHAQRLRDGLAGPLGPGEIDALSAEAFALASLAMLMGLEEMGLCAHACEDALAALAAGPPEPAPLTSVLAVSAGALAAAFDSLARPDASGARADDEPLIAARRALEAALRPAPGPAPRSEAAPDDERWVPTVDDDMVDLFLEEARDRLEALAQKLVQLENRPGDGDLVREVFRDLHTVKGSSGMVGLLPMNRLAHAAEDLVGQLRDGARAVDTPAVDALLAACDGLRALLAQAAARAPLTFDPAPLLDRLKRPAAAPPPAPAAPLASPPERERESKQTLRVDFDKLDLLMNLVGELVLSKAGLSAGIQGLASLGRELENERRLARRAVAGAATRGLRALADELGRVERVFLELASDLDTASARLDHVSAELRDQVMKLRMVPIAGTFRKYHRTVRDLAHGLGKRVRLELAGEDTELDKVLVEQLEDPLMHLVRNAVDHGIEDPEARARAGKPAEGLLRLSASHLGNQILIQIRDDGAGIDPARLRAKARAKGIFKDGGEAELAALDDHQVLELIFRPGFSTAERVSELSGRGVGLDVVKDTIVGRLKGAVELSSAVGAGTTFTLKLPLTLAIIQVLLCRAGGEVFALPLDAVTRTLTCGPADVRVLIDRESLPFGDRQIPLIRLRDVLALGGEADDFGDGVLHVILVEVFGATYGLACDRLLGKQEIVIKSLGDLLAEVPCAAGATLLGDRCALILDVPAVVARALQTGRPPPARPPAPPSPPTAAPAAPRARVLLVEDSETVRSALRRMLEGDGYGVVEARDGVEGLRLARAERFDLVSTDVVMPNMDGYELTRALRASDAYRDTPIIMVTSRGEKIDRVRGFDAGVDEYITKPHDRQELLRAVARHVKVRDG